MPRKQRFKPSRKPKVATGTQTEIVAIDPAAAAATAIGVARSQDTIPAAVEPDSVGARDPGASPSAIDAGGGSG